MKTDRKALESFLSADAPDVSMVWRAMSAAEPVFSLMESGAYPLYRQDQIDTDSTAEALGHLCGWPASLEMISLSLPSGMDEDVWRNDVWKGIERRIAQWIDQGKVIGGGGTSLWEFLNEVFLPSAVKKLCPSTHHRDYPGSLLGRFNRCFHDTVPASAWCKATLPSHLRNSNVFQDGGTLRFNFLDSLYYPFLAVMAGDAEAFSRLEPLVRLLPHVVPLGMDAAGRWLIPVR